MILRRLIDEALRELDRRNWRQRLTNVTLGLGEVSSSPLDKITFVLNFIDNKMTGDRLAMKLLEMGVEKGDAYEFLQGHDTGRWGTVEEAKAFLKALAITNIDPDGKRLGCPETLDRVEQLADTDTAIRLVNEGQWLNEGQRIPDFQIALLTAGSFAHGSANLGEVRWDCNLDGCTMPQRGYHFQETKQTNLESRFRNETANKWWAHYSAPLQPVPNTHCCRGVGGALFREQLELLKGIDGHRARLSGEDRSELVRQLVFIDRWKAWDRQQKAK